MGALRPTWEAVRPWVSPGDMRAINIWGGQPPVLPVFLPILLPHLDPSRRSHSTPSTWLSHPTPGFLLCGALPSASLPAFPSVLDLATPRAGPEPGEAFTEIPQIPTPLHTDLLSSDSWTLTSALWHLSLQGPGAVLPVGPRGLHSGEMLKMVPLSAMPVVSGPQNGGRSWGGVPRSACA